MNQLIYQIPVEKVDAARGNLSEAWGFLMGLCDKNEQIPLYAQDALKGYIHVAREALADLELVVVP